MVFTWQQFINIIIFASVGNAFSAEASLIKINPVNWRLVEALAEEHPYIVALLNVSKEYLCTGSVINKRTVLTSGSCIVPQLHYIAMGCAVLNKNINNNSLFEIAKTTLHEDYTFELKSTEPNVTKMHSNIGLIFSVEPALDAFMPAADLGNYYAPELQEKNLKTIGYGRISEIDTVVLQFQDYRQSPCMNPKWYYCICGYEYSKYSKMYEGEFGQGAPVFMGSELVGVSASPSGILELKSIGMKYNIFTILGPYLPWIDKIHSNVTRNLFFRSGNSAHGNVFTHVYGLLAAIKILY